MIQIYKELYKKILKGVFKEIQVKCFKLKSKEIQKSFILNGSKTKSFIVQRS